jgi:hypothetical protein
VVAVVSHDDPTDSDSNTEQHAGYSVTASGSGQNGQQHDRSRG